MKKIISILAVVVLAGCSVNNYAALTDGGEKVKIVSKEPIHCEYKGDFYSVRAGASMFNSKEEINQMYERYIRNKAAELGANSATELYINRKSNFAIFNFYKC